jgi:hypothetical protein
MSLQYSTRLRNPESAGLKCTYHAMPCLAASPALYTTPRESIGHRRNGTVSLQSISVIRPIPFDVLLICSTIPYKTVKAILASDPHAPLSHQ